MNIQFNPKFAGVFKQPPTDGKSSTSFAPPTFPKDLYSGAGETFYLTGQAKQDFEDPRIQGDRIKLFDLMEALVKRAKDTYDPSDLS